MSWLQHSINIWLQKAQEKAQQEHQQTQARRAQHRIRTFHTNEWLTFLDQVKWSLGLVSFPPESDDSAADEELYHCLKQNILLLCDTDRDSASGLKLYFLIHHRWVAKYMQDFITLLRMFEERCRDEHSLSTYLASLDPGLHSNQYTFAQLQRNTHWRYAPPPRGALFAPMTIEPTDEQTRFGMGNC